MKKGIYKLSLVVIITALTSFTISDYILKKNTAEVEQVEGLFIFTDSKPVMEYEYIGTVKAVMGMDSQYNGVRNKLIRKARKKFPNGEAIMLHFKSGGVDRADIIKFK